jgi:hypothetical protein
VFPKSTINNNTQIEDPKINFQEEANKAKGH